MNEWHCRLENNNCVFQVELIAILNALDWVESQENHIKFFSDSFFSLEAIHTFRTKDPLILVIKNKLMHLGGLTYLAHVSSHSGVIGNERVMYLLKKVLSRCNKNSNLYQNLTLKIF